MSAVYVVEAMRSPIGRYGGGLARVRPDDLAAIVLARTWERLAQPASIIDEVILGCANQAGEDNRNIARMATLLAGFPQHVPAITVNRLCASGLDAINAGFRRIRLGEADVVVTGGVESMSRAPWVMGKPYTDPPRGNGTMFDTALGWRFPNPALEAIFPLEAMGMTAERLVDDYQITREAQDAFALRSHQRALAAQAQGRFERELVPITVQHRRKETVVSADEGPRTDSTAEKLAKLRAVFRQGGSVTAGNSSTLNDGAAVVVLASEAAVERHGWTPLARVVGVAQAGVDPTRMGIGPVPATDKLLKSIDWRINDVDLIELNEAFSAQSLAVMANWDVDPERVNPNGGAIALGHPLGCSGARIVTTLVHEMQRRQAQRGLATLCVGVGQGVATAFERP